MAEVSKHAHVYDKTKPERLYIAMRDVVCVVRDRLGVSLQAAVLNHSHISVAYLLAHGVPHVGGLALLGPVGIELVDLHRDVAKAREIVRLENLRKATLAEQPVQHVPRARRVRTEGVPKASQPARILVALPAQLTNVRDFLCL